MLLWTIHDKQSKNRTLLSSGQGGCSAKSKSYCHFPYEHLRPTAEQGCPLLHLGRRLQKACLLYSTLMSGAKSPFRTGLVQYLRVAWQRGKTTMPIMSIGGSADVADFQQVNIETFATGFQTKDVSFCCLSFAHFKKEKREMSCRVKVNGCSLYK